MSINVQVLRKANLLLRRLAYAVAIFQIEPCLAKGFNLTLEGGKLYGPGGYGEHNLQDGIVSEFIVTSELTGHIPMFNNGDLEPNILAEKSHVGEIDGTLSDGTPINEHVDAGFVLEITEGETKENVQLLVCSIKQEVVEVDENGNLVFKVTAGFDPGLADLVVSMDVVFVTGLARVPLSEKTRRGLPGGTDRAGPYESGYQHIGRLGDFDNDGFLDGEFVLGGQAPYELILAEGDPILVIRPFASNIPVNPIQAASYTLTSINTNFHDPVVTALSSEAFHDLRRYTEDMHERLNTIKANLARAAKVRKRSLSSKEKHSGRLSQVSVDLDQAIHLLQVVKEDIKDKNVGAASSSYMKLRQVLLSVSADLRSHMS